VIDFVLYAGGWAAAGTELSIHLGLFGKWVLNAGGNPY
jgi:hypothetical protein